MDWITSLNLFTITASIYMYGFNEKTRGRLPVLYPGLTTLGLLGLDLVDPMVPDRFKTGPLGIAISGVGFGVPFLVWAWFVFKELFALKRELSRPPS